MQPCLCWIRGNFSYCNSFFSWFILMNKNYFPFIISVTGCLLDWISTQVGLFLGYVETHLTYSLINALFFWVFICFALEMGYRIVGMPGWFLNVAILISTVSFIGFVNNTLVIIGVFGGLIL